MILLTGATGYIASHTWLALEAAGYAVAGIDDFSNSSREVLRRLTALGADVSHFVAADVRDRAALDRLFEGEAIEAVVHFAAHKAVGESVAEPLKYYANNVGGLVTLAEAMRDHGCRTIVFSSSATVYGDPQRLPITEDAPLSSTNPYGATKLVGEGLLGDLARSDPSWRIALLRYFNPVGAHESGTIGEDPRGTPNNLMPYVAQVAVGKRDKLQVFGGDYDTPDGTGVRDYLHVVDLAEGHVAALRHLLGGAGSLTVNLGTGRGSSVLELVHAFERASGRRVPYEIAARRPGDVASCYADPALAAQTIGWTARRDLDAMCADTWRWQTRNPNGFADAA
jgi:UDP-glucose 4-epimerase